MGFYTMKKRCPHCASELDKNGECSCATFQAVKAMNEEKKAVEAEKDKK